MSVDTNVGKRTYSKQSPLQRLTSSRTSVLQFGRPLRRHFFKTDVLEDVRFANSDVLEDVRFFLQNGRVRVRLGSGARSSAEGSAAEGSAAQGAAAQGAAEDWQSGASWGGASWGVWPRGWAHHLSSGSQ